MDEPSELQKTIHEIGMGEIEIDRLKDRIKALKENRKPLLKRLSKLLDATGRRTMNEEVGN